MAGLGFRWRPSGPAHEYAGGSNVIEANVRSLRRKLGDRAGSIETVRGLGYRFSVPVRSEADARI